MSGSFVVVKSCGNGVPFLVRYDTALDAMVSVLLLIDDMVAPVVKTGDGSLTVANCDGWVVVNGPFLADKLAEYSGLLCSRKM